MSPVFSVSEFLRQTNELIATTCVIEGEVSHYSVSQGKWVFFDIKDEQSSLSCFSTTFVARVPLETGMKVRVVGYPKVYEKTGKFSFTVQKLELVGEGSFKKAFVLLKNALEKEGLFRIDRKRSLPVIPERLGVITSRDSAAWGDFRRIINNRFGAVELVVRHVNVQGSEAVADIVQAFEKIQGVPVYYSLGNFIFDQYFDEAVRSGLAVRVKISNGGLVTEEIPVYINKDGTTCPLEG